MENNLLLWGKKVLFCSNIYFPCKSLKSLFSIIALAFLMIESLLFLCKCDITCFFSLCLGAGDWSKSGCGRASRWIFWGGQHAQYGEEDDAGGHERLPWHWWGHELCRGHEVRYSPVWNRSPIRVKIIPTADLRCFLLPPQVSKGNELLCGGLRHRSHWPHTAAA